MTFCTQCGTDNDESTKYCRECGKRLQSPEPRSAAAAPAQTTSSADETAVGEVLYEGFQLYESGKLDEAAAKCRNALSLNPRSSSAHALLSMIHEKNAEVEEKNGNTQAAMDYLALAVRERESVLKLSPGSVVDAHKLRELKRKLRGSAKTTPDLTALKERVAAFLGSIPLPVLASTAAAAVVFVIAFSILSSSDQKSQKPGNTRSGAVQQTQGQPQAGAANQYTYPYPTQDKERQAKEDIPTDDDLDFISPEQDNEPSRKSGAVGGAAAPTIQPPARMQPPAVKVPQIPAPPVDLQVVPLDKDRKPPTEEPKAAENIPPKPSHSVQAPPKPEIEIAPAEKTGADYQREAMRLYGEGKRDEAARLFHRAIDAYNSQIANGVDVDAANAGIRTCRSYLRTLE